jgi:hypothetical protein
MSESTPPEENLADEFRNLGKNLANALQAAWDNPERKRIVKEVETNLNELGDTLKNEAEHFSESPTAQRLKSDIEQLGERVRSSETQEKVRREVIKILQSANNELKKVIDRWSDEGGGGEAASSTPVEPVELREKDE